LTKTDQWKFSGHGVAALASSRHSTMHRSVICHNTCSMLSLSASRFVFLITS